MYVGAYDLSGDALTISNMQNEFASAQVTGWSEQIRNFISASFRENISINGFRALMNDDTGRALTIIQDAPNDYPVSLFF